MHLYICVAVYTYVDMDLILNTYEKVSLLSILYMYIYVYIYLYVYIYIYKFIYKYTKCFLLYQSYKYEFHTCIDTFKGLHHDTNTESKWPPDFREEFAGSFLFHFKLIIIRQWKLLIRLEFILLSLY
jgi:hypothetical protein